MPGRRPQRKNLLRPCSKGAHPRRAARLARVVLAGAVALTLTCPARAQELEQPPMPGDGVSVQIIKSPQPEDWFQTIILARALQRLGYAIKPVKESDYGTALEAVASGEADVMPAFWAPLHDGYFRQAGGEERLWMSSHLVKDNTMGYLIDRKTARTHNITHIDQLRDPALAGLFDHDGDGKADLVGCDTYDAACEQAIAHHLDSYALTETVAVIKGDYSALSTALLRYRTGEPVLLFAWVPHWITYMMQPGQTAQWLKVPFSAEPGRSSPASTRQPDGSDYGFAIASQHIVANRSFTNANHAATRLFEVMEIPAADISVQNRRMNEGEDARSDIENHVNTWLAMNQDLFDGWISRALSTTGENAESQ